jgi:hypothetical protein
VSSAITGGTSLEIGGVATGGVGATAGLSATGGVGQNTASPGGNTQTGGISATAGAAGGSIVAGGTTTTGGRIGTAGATVEGGGTASGGKISSGGSIVTGGTSGTGGKTAAGGTTVAGGSKAPGGSTAAGGTSAIGGTTATGGVATTGWVTIHNDFFWYDDTGAAIETRAGCLRKFGDTYYWYGLLAWQDPKAWNDQTCYASTDLVHWTNKGIALHVVAGANRMDVLYNDTTKKYVMFLKYGGDAASLGFATSSTPEGPYTLLNETQVDGANIGDMSMYEDDDGKAYLA